MKPKLFISLACVFCMASTTTFAQLKINSDGSAAAANFTMDGVIGNPNGNGVLTVSGTRLHIKYNPSLSPAPGLIRTKDAASGVFAFSNLQRNTINFYVKSNGNLYATALLLPQATAALNRNARAASAFTLTSTLDKLQSIHGVVYQESEIQEQAALQSTAMPANTNETSAREQQAQSLQQIQQQIETEKERKRIGLLANEVEQVLPDVVRTLPDGTKGILYSDLVAVLIEGMKELQDSLAVQGAEIRELKNMLANRNTYYSPEKEAKAASVHTLEAQACLYPNIPNPFNRETEIAYRLRKDARTAAVCIYNLNGLQLKKYPLAVDSPAGKLTLSAAEFQPGMYIYALIIDDEMVDSKRMTLTD